LASPNHADALALTFAFPVKSSMEKRMAAQYNTAYPFDPLSMEIRSGEKRFNPLALFANRN